MLRLVGIKRQECDDGSFVFVLLLEMLCSFEEQAIWCQTNQSCGVLQKIDTEQVEKATKDPNQSVHVKINELLEAKRDYAFVSACRC